MLRVDGAEYFFSTWFATIPSKELTNLLLTAKSEKEVAEKLKELEEYQEGEAGPSLPTQAYREGLSPSVVERQDAQEDSEAGPGPATQAYREETLISKPPPINRNAGSVIGRFQEGIQNEV